ncbi:hypothetical protein Nhal_0991 [Nitrosococcus halophilus Nc 4]|uniref:ParB/Sulfiredoxin domain-containing protein n=1 Tax=Nitrosococcus halophilus (strain Nc4) TaxID=472759 RepID=D5BYV1_NITHN|nr:hypothetical protein [Nitrosococcus halophilus]ADE14164.1 hypothetical protein Nhal_0991 [Nitrosococcus halophilus Nc 4]
MTIARLSSIEYHIKKRGDVAVETKSAQVKVGSLLLDPKNTRIPSDRRSDNQRQLLQELLAHENVKSLASSIAKLGLFANERLVVVSNGPRFTVLEGNRRLAAIKLLLKPELAPTDTQVNYFRKLSSETDLSELERIDVAIVPDRLSAVPIIAALHTGDAKRKWSSLQQARFYYELVEEGLTPLEISERIGVSLAQVRNFLRSEKLHRIALSLDLDAEIRQKIEDPRFPLTTLERFIESQVGRKFLGIELNDEKGFRGIVHPDRFKAVLSQVVSDVATTKGMTRKINDESGFKGYIKEVEEKLPKTNKRGSFDPDEFLGRKDDFIVPDAGTKRSAAQRKYSPKPSPSVVPRGFVCRSRNSKISTLFKEIKSFKIIEQRNSTGVMLRVLIDIALWEYIKKEGHAKAVCNHFDKNGKQRTRNPDWTPRLRDMISYAVDKRIFPGMTADGYKSVRSLASRDTLYFITIDGFNEFTHNPYVTPTEGDLRVLWQRAEPMLEIILN